MTEIVSLMLIECARLPHSQTEAPFVFEMIF